MKLYLISYVLNWILSAVVWLLIFWKNKVSSFLFPSIFVCDRIGVLKQGTSILWHKNCCTLTNTYQLPTVNECPRSKMLYLCHPHTFVNMPNKSILLVAPYWYANQLPYWLGKFCIYHYYTKIFCVHGCPVRTWTRQLHCPVWPLTSQPSNEDWLHKFLKLKISCQWKATSCFRISKLQIHRHFYCNLFWINWIKKNCPVIWIL